MSGTGEISPIAIQHLASLHLDPPFTCTSTCCQSFPSTYNFVSKKLQQFRILDLQATNQSTAYHRHGNKNDYCSLKLYQVNIITAVTVYSIPVKVTGAQCHIHYRNKMRVEADASLLADDFVINETINCHYFQPGPRSTSRPQSIIAFLHRTKLYCQMTCVKNMPRKWNN